MDANDEEHSFSKKLINKVYDDKQYADVEFIVGDDVIVYANKLVLAMVCPYFAEMFYGKNKNQNVKVVKYSTERKISLKIVLQFIYKDFVNEVKLSDDQKIGVYALAKELNFTDLADIVEFELNGIEITIENVAKLFEVASSNGLKWLVDKCWSFIDKNSEDLVKSKDVFSKFPANLVLEIVKRDTFYANEMEIFDAVHHWSESNPEEDAKEIMKHLRFKLISVEEFAKTILKTGLITYDDYFRVILETEKRERIKVEGSPVEFEMPPPSRNNSTTSMTEHNRLAISALSDLLFDNRFSDVSFTFDDNEIIPAHKVILAAACPYYKNLFNEDMRNTAIETVMIPENPKLFRLFLDFIYGKNVSFESLSDTETVEIFTLAQKVNFTPMLETVAKYMGQIAVTIENLAVLYTVAAMNGLSTLKDNCVFFAEKNGKELIARKDLFTKLPKDLVEEIVRQNMRRDAYEALKEWKSENPYEDISDLLSALPLQWISPREFAADIRPTNLISDEQYFEAHLSHNPTTAAVSNAVCDFHKSKVCNPKVVRIFSRHSKGRICEEIRTFETERQAHKFKPQGESVVVEFENACLVNTIKFQLNDEYLRLYSYEVQIGVRKENLEIVKPHLSGRYYASKQEIVFQAKHVKFLQITSFENHPLEVYLWTIEAVFNNGLGNELNTVNPGNLIAHLPIDEKAKAVYNIFNDRSDEIVYVLRYPSKVSTVGIQLNGFHGSKLTLFTKAHIRDEWQQQAVVDSLECNTVIIFKESMVSFIKLDATQIRDKIRHVECPATSNTFHV